MSDAQTDAKPANEASASSSSAENAAANANVSPSKKETDQLSMALQHLASGKRNMLVRDVSAAVDSFAESSKILGELYGDVSKECSESYFYYGKALLELARMERGIVGSMGGGDESADNSTEDEEDEEAEKKEEGEKEEAKEGEDAKEGEEKKEGESSENKGEKEKGEKEEETAEKDENESIGSNDAGTSDVKEAHDQAEIEAEDEEEPSNLQLAWEILELAKVCYQKHSDSLEAADPKRMELELRLTETYQTLGELSIENENYQQAVDDLTACLKRRQDLLPEDSRSIAETHYQLGVAHGFNLEFDRAVQSLEDAIIVLQKRVDNLKAGKHDDEFKSSKDAFHTPEKEVKDIESLIPEIKEKIVDTRDMRDETVKKLGDRALMEDREIEAVSAGSAGAGSSGSSSAAAAFANGDASNGDGDASKKNKGGTTKGSSANGSSNGNSSAAKPINDISLMVKKRKKPEVAEAAAASNGNGLAESEAKKPHLETANGSSS